SNSTAIPGVRTLTGYVTPFGAVNGTLIFTGFTPTGGFTAVFTLNAAGGTVSGTVSGQFLTPDGRVYSETITFTSGTGRDTGIGCTAPRIGVRDGPGGLDLVTGGEVSY